MPELSGPKISTTRPRGSPPMPEREVERERARRDGADRHLGAVAHLHHRALAELTLDLPEGDVESFLAVHPILLILTSFSGNDSSTSYLRPGRVQT